jgi:hypothetical protein
MLPENYNYVNNFDNYGYTFFTVGTKSGIIDTTGKEILPPKFIEMEQFTDGLFRYSVEKGYLFYSLPNNSKIPCNWSRELAKSWILLKQEGAYYLLHTTWKNPLAIQSEKSIIQLTQNYAYVKNLDDSFSLFSPTGKLIDTSIAVIRNSFNTLYVKGEKVHFIVSSTGKIDLPLAANNVNFTSKEIHYALNEKVYLTDRETNKIIFSTEGDNLFKTDKYYFVYKNRKQGIVSFTGESILPPIYDYIYSQQGNFVVSQDGNVGLVDKQGKQLIPCMYSSILPTGEYYRTTLFTGTQGLLSALNFREILPPYFSKINCLDKSIKAWGNNRLIVLELDKNHKEINRLCLNNVVSMNVYNDINKLKSIDVRLFKLGWFFETKTSINPTNKTRVTNYLWGIKEDDSVRLVARLKTPVYIEGAEFSMLSKQKIEEKINSNLYGTIKVGNAKYTYDAFNVKKLRNVNQVPIVLIDTVDFLNKSFAKIQTTTSMGVIYKNGSTKNYCFIDDESEGFSRYCTGSRSETSNYKAKDAIYFSDFLTRYGCWVSEYTPKTITNGTWNFLNNQGDSVFHENFQFAENFHKETALVLGKKGWGVVRATGVIIPTQYTAITRVYHAKDTLFLVQRKKDRLNYLDSNLTNIPFPISKIKAQNDSLIVIQNNNEHQLVTQQNKVIETNSRAYFLVNNHFVINKIGKIYNIRSSNLTQLGTSILKPISFFMDSYFTVEKNKVFALMNLQGDTVLGFENGSIEIINDIMVVKNFDGKIIVYNRSFKKILRKKYVAGMSIIYDSIQKHIAYLHNQKVYIYDTTGKELAKFTLQPKEYISQFYNGLIYLTSGKILTYTGTCINPEFPQEGYLTIANNYLIFKDKFDKEHIFDTSGTELYPLDYKHQIKYHGEDVFSYIDDNNKIVVIDHLTHQKYYFINHIIGSFNSGFLLTIIEGKYVFLNREFHPVFQKEFDKALPFKHGVARVFIEKGWTLIDTNGFQKSLPIYDEIDQKTNGIFTVETHAYFGVYDSHGTVIVEPRYTKIKFLDEGIIQATLLGTIDYYTLDGKRLE